jgi:Zn-dependent M16 (insulinase) family peptidase
LELLFAYLSESPISPLQKSFVEIEDPFCTDIDFSFLDFSSSSFFCELANVPCEKESEIQSLFLETLRSHSFDLERMKVVIERQILSESEEAETNPHHSMSVRLISDFLYGATTGSDCLLFFEFQKHANEIKNGWNVSDWKSLMETWLLAPNHILLFGKPSKEYAKNMAEIEKSRVKQQVMDLGPSNLSKLDKELENAKSINELPIPGSLLETFRIPSVDSINFHNVGIQGHSIFLSSNLQSDSRFRVEDSNANLSFNSIFFNGI